LNESRCLHAGGYTATVILRALPDIPGINVPSDNHYLVRLLAPADLARMVGAAAELDLEVVLEIRDESELEQALRLGAQLIGVNNRNLETLAVDSGTAARLIPLIPRDRIAIYESGVRDAGDARTAAATGADAMLVGSALSVAADAERAVRALCGVARIARVG